MPRAKKRVPRAFPTAVIARVNKLVARGVPARRIAEQAAIHEASLSRILAKKQRPHALIVKAIREACDVLEQEVVRSGSRG